MIDLASAEVIADGLAFPEGPIVMADGSVIVVEMTGGVITRCWGDGRKETIASPGGGPNGAAIGPDGALYVCNNGGIDLNTLHSKTGPGHEGRVERVDLSTGRVERIYECCGENALSGPNDIIFDSGGYMWFTDLGKTHGNVHEMGGIFRARPDGSEITEVHRGIVSYNGVGLSPDGSTVYTTDMYCARLVAFDTSLKGGADARRLVGTAPGFNLLDSLAVTASGNICVGQLGEGAIVVFSPSGELEILPFPDQFTTNIAFGGDDMQWAYVTQSMTGKLLKLRWNEPGLRLQYNG